MIQVVKNIRRRLLRSCSTKSTINTAKTISTAAESAFKNVPPSAYVLLTIPVTTFCLGVWQIKRRKWKLNLLQKLEDKLKIPAVPVPMLEDLTPDRQYELFILEGEYLHDKETFVGPRIKLTDDAGGLLSKGDYIGAFVITPFKLTSGEVVLINRGWISKQLQRNYDDIERPTGTQTVKGIYRLSESVSVGTGATTYDNRSRMWSRRDVDKLAQAFDCLPYSFDLNVLPPRTQISPTSPIPGQTVIQLRNEHMSYIITWFTLTLILSIAWYRRFLMKKPKLSFETLMKSQDKYK